jgi:hypothetical protein
LYCARFPPHIIATFKVDEVLEVGREEDEAECRYVVKVNVAEWEERDVIVDVTERSKYNRALFFS